MRKTTAELPWITTGVALALLVLPSVADAGFKPPAVTNGGYMQATVGDKAVVLPLRHTDYQAEVAGVVASVTVTQDFANPYRRPIEARYVFPLPHDAAVYRMRLEVGERVIEGVVKRRKKARAIYRRARRAGRTAALLEQQRPNIFTQTVANILPGERIKVRITYVAPLSPRGSQSTYELALPLVVGPRYIGGRPLRRQPSGGGWGRDTDRVPDASKITPRMLAKGLRPGHDVSVRLTINGGAVSLRQVSVLTHRAKVAFSPSGQQGAPARSLARITLDPRDAIPNKDFVVRYRLAGKRPRASLLLHRGPKGGGHLLLTVQPPARPKRSEIAPREYVFVVDSSGSMSGFPLQQAQRVVRRLLATVRSSDTVRVIKFAGEPGQLSPRPLRATPANIRRAVRYVTAIRGGGGTEFLPALRLALDAPKDPARSRIVLFITDGYVGDEPQILRLLRQRRRSASLFALGIGSSVNRFLIDGMARLGAGEPFVLLNTEQSAEVVGRITAVLSRPALTGIDIDWGGLPVREVTPAALPDLFAGRPLVVTGRLDRAAWAKLGQPASLVVKLRGRLAGKPYIESLSVAVPAAGATVSNRAVPRLWARQRIRELSDLAAADPERAKWVKLAITRIALLHNLISRYTSLVAVDARVRNRGGKQTRVDVPVHRPHGVSGRAAPPAAYAGKAAAAAVVGSHGPDNDRDAILDVDDACPNEPETYNGYADRDGCPDRARVVVHKGRIEVLDKIYFRQGSAKIRPLSYPILDAIAATMGGNPQITLVELQGHAAVGERRPKALAVARARAVRAYLIRKGVAASRLVARGYARTKPVDRRNNQRAWSRNRRVEFLILKRQD